MSNTTMNLLNIQDVDVIVKTKLVTNSTKILEISKRPKPMFCPHCGFRMHSKGIRVRNVKHQILQDGFQLVLEVHQRRWMCTNESCRNLLSDEFSFLSPGRRTTNLTDLMIVDAFRNPQLSAVDIARQFNVSDTHALNVFAKYVDMQRLPLSTVISLDEIHLNMPGCLYALVIYDFTTSELIDVLPSRANSFTEEYFTKIPAKERAKVKYLISDMYAPYINYVYKYFPNAVPVIDSFHVIKALNYELDTYAKKLLREFQKRDEAAKVLQGYSPGRRSHQSDEVYLLKHHRWILLANPFKTKDKNLKHWDRHFRAHLDAYSYESFFFKIDPSLHELRKLKEKYHEFNEFCIGNPYQAQERLDDLIHLYSTCSQPTFNRFAFLLKKHRVEIINSFNTVSCNGIERRLSNGPIESMNRIPKDMKRHARGYGNFEHIRNRLLFSVRKDAPILGVPKTNEEIKVNTGKSRGPYRKKTKQEQY